MPGLPRVHLVIGTRPEAIKMAPLVAALRTEGLIDPVVVATGQHSAMVKQSLGEFGQKPDVQLSIDRKSGEQAELVGLLAPAIDGVLHRDRSAGVVVQGDTTSAFIGGLAAFWRKLPLFHLEAGLRSGDLASPFPEEANRRLLGVIADLHLAPTRRAMEALLKEHADPNHVVLVGNTVVDAVIEGASDTSPLKDRRLAQVERLLDARLARLVLVTAHRRESWGAPLDRILAAVEQIVNEHPDLQCVLPAHPNPAVRAQVDRALATHPQVTVVPPLPYRVLCRLLSRASIVLSDSGGIQEEAPSFRVPVLVLRDVTERSEAVEAGWAQLVGTDGAIIVAAAKEILDGRYRVPELGNPFGDGRSAARCAKAIGWWLGLCEKPADFSPELSRVDS
jgi:UDP-N-acetylglucosamine 2-epimerase (non-hydrolysing)